jgi:predicted enzyme related to lactoylglutathione lyase
MKIGLVEVFVDDQDNARDFYIGQLGLQIKDDAPYGTGQLWLTVVSPEDPGGTELLLAPLNGAARALQVHRRATGTPAVSFTVDDCDRRYHQLRNRGVEFVSGPEAMGYGGIDAMFEDGCGNLCSLHQEGAGHG